MDQVGDISRSAMGRVACINIQVLPLQLLLRKHPTWKNRSVALIKKDTPQSPILLVNSVARRAGIRSGMRYSSALSLDQNLSAGTVSDKEIQKSLQQILKLLDRFSPRVELYEEEPGIFWIDAMGLDKLYGSLEDWTRQIVSQLSHLQFHVSISVGFTRFGSYVSARLKNRVIVFPSSEVEKRECRKVRLRYLHLDPMLHDRLEKLAIHTVGDFLDLPENSIGINLGKQAWRFYQFASGELSLPIQSHRFQEPLCAWIDLNECDCNSMRLLFWIKRLFNPILKKIAERCQAVSALQLQILFENGERHRHRIQAARPTLQGAIILDLVRLHLETVSFHVLPVELFFRVEGVRVSAEELNLLQKNPLRNSEAAMNALARLRAEFGPGSVLSVRLKSGHLPEACFEWQSFKSFNDANPRFVSMRSLIRRIYARPEFLGKSPEKKNLSPGSRRFEYRINGGWWNREVRRNYRFVKSERGEILWIFYDELRRSWYSQGRVE